MPKFSPERRRFTLAAAAAATTAVINPADALAGISQAAAAPPASSGAPQTNPAPSPALNQQAQAAFDKLSPSGKAEVEMKFASIVRKYGARLNDEQKTDIRRQLAEGQEGLDKMRAFALDNSDQPATVFQLYRHEGKK